MNFLSAQFVLLFPVILLAWRFCPRPRRWIVLLAASWLFYLTGQPQAFPLLLLATGVCYLAALRIAQSTRPAARRGWLALALVTCLGILFLFKYLGFAASVFGISVPPLLLPVGISFYTFQNLSYVIDAYRGMQPERSSAGLLHSEIARSPAGGGPHRTPPEPSAPAPRRPGPHGGGLRAGAQLLLRGYCKKLILADFAARFVDPVYAAPGQAAGPAVVAATVLFALQIYGDFSGYSDIARGAARLMGVRLMQNFDAPLHRRLHPGVLAPVAHQPDQLAHRLSLHSLGRQPLRKTAPLRQYPGGISGQRSLARRQLDLCGLGRSARRGPGGGNAAARPPPAAPAAGPGAHLRLCLLCLDLFPGGHGGAGLAADRRPCPPAGSPRPTWA